MLKKNNNKERAQRQRERLMSEVEERLLSYGLITAQQRQAKAQERAQNKKS